MEIEDTTGQPAEQEQMPPSLREALAEENKVEEEKNLGFEFKLIPQDMPNVFPNFKTKETTDKFWQWGLKDSTQTMKYRFNKNFHLIAAEAFLKDLFNSADVVGSFPPLAQMAPGTCTGVKFQQLNCSVLNMAFFDVFQEVGVVTEGGNVLQCLQEFHEGINLGDKLRQVLLWEDMEDLDAYETVQDNKYQHEFIFKLFQHIAIGGGECQWETNINEYLKITKNLYKDLVVVAKDGESQQLRCFSHAFKIETIQGYENKLYNTPNDNHPQDCFYVVVDPINWHVNFFYNKWVSFW